jgi:hypothetical protein
MPSRPRSRTLLAVFFASGLCTLAFTWTTVHQRGDAEFAATPVSRLIRTEVLNWRQHGYFASYGLLVPTADPHRLYRSWPGDFMVSSYVVTLVAGFDHRLLAIHNLLISLVAASLLALLAYRLMIRIGVDAVHAVLLAIGLEMVQFTFPENLGIFWEMTAQMMWLVTALLFLLIEERAVEARTRRMDIGQALLVFAMVRLQYVYATMFLAVYLLIAFVLRGERPALRRLVLTIAAPAAAAMAIFAGQLLLAKYDPDVKLYGSRFLYRTGLDGDGELYGDHLDIAFGRDFIREQRPGNRQYLFHWPVLFSAGVLAAIVSLLGYLRDRIPRIAVVPLLTLLGAYVMHAAVFSQLVALHPYLFDPVLVTPLIFALFALVPAFAEAHTARTGLVTLVTFLAAVWTSFYQLRIYALCYPN